MRKGGSDQRHKKGWNVFSFFSRLNVALFFIYRSWFNLPHVTTQTSGGRKRGKGGRSVGGGAKVSMSIPFEEVILSRVYFSMTIFYIRLLEKWNIYHWWECYGRSARWIRPLPCSFFLGGGQILRNSVALAAIMKKKLKVVNIRANRPRGGGLRPQHLCGIQLVAQLHEAKLIGGVREEKERENI